MARVHAVLRRAQPAGGPRRRSAASTIDFAQMTVTPRPRRAAPDAPGVRAAPVPGGTPGARRPPARAAARDLGLSRRADHAVGRQRDRQAAQEDRAGPGPPALHPHGPRRRLHDHRRGPRRDPATRRRADAGLRQTGTATAAGLPSRCSGSEERAHAHSSLQVPSAPGPCRSAIASVACPPPCHPAQRIQYEAVGTQGHGRDGALAGDAGRHRHPQEGRQRLRRRRRRRGHAQRRRAVALGHGRRRLHDALRREDGRGRVAADDRRRAVRRHARQVQDQARPGSRATSPASCPATSAAGHISSKDTAR